MSTIPSSVEHDELTHDIEAARRDAAYRKRRDRLEAWAMSSPTDFIEHVNEYQKEMLIDVAIRLWRDQSHDIPQRDRAIARSVEMWVHEQLDRMAEHDEMAEADDGN